MTDLPVNGRAFTQIQQLVPGASRTMGDEGGTGFNSSRGFALNGQQEEATGFEVDGVENTDVGNGTGMMTSPGLEAISEMKVNTTDYSAEFGNAAGASLLVVTRTGTDKFHGAAYEFFKNDALDAVNYFSLSNEKLRFNDTGIGLAVRFSFHASTRSRNRRHSSSLHRSGARMTPRISSWPPHPRLR
jgi:hypothetical protein